MGEPRKPDFSGYASKYGIVCADGLTIMHNAFKHLDKVKLPLVWNHNHKDNEQVLGHVIIEHRDQGPYVHAFLNKSAKGQAARDQLENGDITMMSIWANDLDRRGTQVFHGEIREVSLVLAGANKEAEIEEVYIRHSADSDPVRTNDAIIRTGEDVIVHAVGEGPVVEGAETTDGDAETVQDIFNTMSEKQQRTVAGMVENAFVAGRDSVAHSATEEGDKAPGAENQDTSASKAVEISAEETAAKAAEASTEGTDANKNSEATAATDSKTGTSAEETASKIEDKADKAVSEEANTDTSNKEGSPTMGDKIEHNAFSGGNVAFKEGERNTPTKIKLSEGLMHTIMKDAFEMKDLESAIIKHAGTEYGIDQIEYLFPEANNLDATPQLLARQVEWVPKVLDAVKRQPFAKVRSIVADLTADEARAKGYIKGNEKQDEVVALMRRTTSPTTIYKKQRLDRDDIIDITEFDVIAWIKWEMRYMLNEELARAILIGDGRPALDRDKIKDPKGQIDGIGIRSILHDDSLYTVKKELAANVGPQAVVEAFIRIRASYRGSGSPTLYTTDKLVSDILLLKDKVGRFLYDTERQLADKLRVKEIVAVEVLESEPTLLGIVVNLVDYSLGTNKGGELSFFDQFDLDFNQEKFLLETRLSGALTRLKSALVLTRNEGTKAVATAPSFDGATNTIAIPTKTGVDYLIDDEKVTGNVVITKDTDVVAEPQAGYYLESNSINEWNYTYTPSNG